MTKADLVDEVVAATQLPKKDVALIGNGHVEIRGFGSFKIKFAKARIARNPRSGETVHVPAKLVPFFKVSRELKNIVEAAHASREGAGEQSAAESPAASPSPFSEPEV